MGSRGDISRMWYVNFGHHVTFKFGVLLESWPLEKFASPHSFSSIPILNILYSAFESGATRFRTLSDEEWRQWREASQVGGSAPAVTAAELLTPVMETDLASADENAGGRPTTDQGPSASEDTTSTALGTSTSAPPATSPAAPPSNVNTPSLADFVAAPDANSVSALTPPMAGGISAPQSLSGEVAAIPANMSGPACLARGQKRTVGQVDGANTTGMFINTFDSPDGGVEVVKRARKKRSDAGVKRGPRKKPAMTNAPPATA